jgi:pheromone shutdown-related protein TraB
MIKIIDRIILIGSSHVGSKSLSEIKDAIDEYKPQVVGIELDTRRFKTLMSKEKGDKELTMFEMIKELGVFGFLFAKVAGSVQKKVGAKIGVKPGIDMKTAYEKARELKIPVSLIDMDLRITMKKLSKISFFKKMGIVFSMIFKSFKKEYRELLDFDLKKVPSDEVVYKMVRILRKEVPELYKILIHDRNIYMGNKLLKLRQNHEGYVIAVVGAGHVEGMEKYLKHKLKEEMGQGFSFSYIAEIEEENNLINNEN